MADPRLRQIKIKTGVVRRLAKEKIMYEKEAKQQEEKIEKMKAEACDDYGIKKQSRAVFSLTRLRLEDLQNSSLSEDLMLTRTNEFLFFALPARSSNYLTLSWYFHSDLQDNMKVKTSNDCELLLKLLCTT